MRVRECPGFLVNRVLVRALAGAYRAGRRARRRHGGRRRGDRRGRARADGPVRAGRPDRPGHARPHPARPARGLRRPLRRRRRDRAARSTPGASAPSPAPGFFDGAAPEAEPDDAGRAVADRYYESALDEARRCIDEDVAAPGDVDLAMRHGCGWSAGPLEWAESDEGRTRDPTQEARPRARAPEPGPEPADPEPEFDAFASLEAARPAGLRRGLDEGGHGGHAEPRGPRRGLGPLLERRGRGHLRRGRPRRGRGDGRAGAARAQGPPLPRPRLGGEPRVLRRSSRATCSPGAWSRTCATRRRSTR